MAQEPGISGTGSTVSWEDASEAVFLSAKVWSFVTLIAIVRTCIHQLWHRSKSSSRQHSTFNDTYRIIYTALRRLRFQAAQWLYHNPRVMQGVTFGHMCGAIMVCIFYVWRTYVELPWMFDQMIAVYGWFCITRHLVHFFMADRPLRFALSPISLIQCLSLPPMVARHPDMNLNLSCLQAFIILQDLAVLDEVEFFVQKNSAMVRLVIMLGSKLGVFIFVSCSMIQFFEVLGDPTTSLEKLKFEITWNNGLYFAVVTLMTVGYGDFVPYTTLGRLWVAANILFAAYLVAREIGQVAEVMSRYRRGGGAYHKVVDIDHVVITGNFRLHMLEMFFREFFLDTRNKEVQVVVLVSNPRWTDIQWQDHLHRNPAWRSQVQFLEGSALRAEDLRRASGPVARAIFVLAEPSQTDPSSEDSNTLKRILAIRAHAPRATILAVTVLAESNFQVKIAMKATDNEDRTSTKPTPNKRSSSAGAAARAGSLLSRRFIGRSDSTEMFSDVRSEFESVSLCLQELQVAFLAENVFCNGISTLLTNLATRLCPVREEGDSPWLTEYKSGGDCHIEYMKVPLSLHGVELKVAALTLFDYGLIVLAFRFHGETDWSLVEDGIILMENMYLLVLTYLDAATVLERTGKLNDETFSPPSSHEVSESDSDLNSPPIHVLRYEADTKAGEPSMPLNRQPSARRLGSLIVKVGEKIPAQLQGHTILCVTGGLGRFQLKYLLQKLSATAHHRRHHFPVVVVGDSFPKSYEEEFAILGKELFFLSGNPQGMATLKRAQYQSAHSIIVIGASEDDDEETGRSVNDSKVIFTVMTLDYVLGEKSNTFVCCVFDSDRSLHLLRAPVHPRRKGTILAGATEPLVLYRSRASLSPFPGERPDEARSLPGSPGGVLRQRSNLTHRTVSNSSMARVGRLPRAYSGFYGTSQSRAAQRGLKRVLSTRWGFGNEDADFVEDWAHHLDRGSPAALVENDLFSRTRYCSGEIMVASVFTALLVREFNEPGFIGFLRSAIGAGIENDKQSCFRLVDIPAKWLDFGGEKTFRDVFERMLEFGVQAIGLYRSGDATVRLHSGCQRSDPAEGDRRHNESPCEWECEEEGNMGEVERLLAGMACDRREYRCPTTGRVTDYEEVDGGGNILPYVYTMPEPFTAVSSSDGVFVFGSPDAEIPSVW